MKRAILGTVIHGTMRNEDVIPACAAYLRTLCDAACPDHDTAHWAVMHDADAWDADRDSYEVADGIAARLFDALDAHAPHGAYFGAHVGDGSDYGFWPMDDHD